MQPIAARAKRTMQRAAAGETPFGAWRNELFRTTRSVLDPQGGHLDHATQSLQSGYGPDGITVGIKRGWTNPGAEGQGMVQVEVTSQGGTDDDLCGEVGPDGLRVLVTSTASCRTTGSTCPGEAGPAGRPRRGR